MQTKFIDGNTFRKILAENSIPSYFDSGSSLFSTNEALEIIEILKLMKHFLCVDSKFGVTLFGDFVRLVD